MIVAICCIASNVGGIVQNGHVQLGKQHEINFSIEVK